MAGTAEPPHGQVQRDRLIYDDLVRLCRSMERSISTTTSRAQGLLALTLASVIGYYVISGKSIGETGSLALLGTGIMLAGSLLLLPTAFFPVASRHSSLDWRYTQFEPDETTRRAVAIMQVTAQRLSSELQRHERIYLTAFIVWVLCMSISVALLIFETLS